MNWPAIFRRRKPVLRDESGRYVSAHRLAVRAKAYDLALRMNMHKQAEVLADG